MAKFKPGIPEAFTLNVEPVSNLGDYLDEPPPTPRPQRKVVEPQPAAVAVTIEPVVPVVTRPVPAVVPVAPAPTPVAPVVEPSPPAVTATPVVQQPAPIPPPPVAAPTIETAAEREERGLRPKAPRREISMTPETLRMSDELLDIIRSGSGQRDTKANELFHALVLLVYEVADELDPHSIPKRGRWGTPTARAYPLELKNAFLKALLRKYADAAGASVDTAA